MRSGTRCLWCLVLVILVNGEEQETTNHHHTNHTTWRWPWLWQHPHLNSSYAYGTAMSSFTDKARELLIPDVQYCLSRIDEPPAPPKPNTLAIIISISQDRVQSEEIQLAANAWTRYANIHGYAFSLRTLDADPLLHFFSDRWSHIVGSSAWGEYEWILGIDGDTLPSHFNMSLEPHLHGPEHLVFHIRENTEVHAGAVLMRTTKFAECFVRYWASKGLANRENPNFDNGDLIQVVLEFVDPELGHKCGIVARSYPENDGDSSSWIGGEKYFHGPYRKYMHCFSPVLWRFHSIHLFMPIRTYFPMQGFFKSLYGHLLSPEEVEKASEDELIWGTCWPNDVIHHGKKMGVDYWKNIMNMSDAQVDPCANHRLPESKLLDVAAKCCLWNYPGCRQGGLNICRRQYKHCTSNPGVPVCEGNARV